MSHRTIFWFLVFLGPSAQIATDIYLPSLTVIADEFGAEHMFAQLSISLYMYAFTLSGFVFGLLSDAYGRRPNILVGLLIFIAGTLCCALATSMPMLMAGRVLQGFGGGAALLARTLGGDVYKGDELAKAASYLSLGSIGLVAAAPLLGGYLQEHFYWQAIFYFLLAFAGALFLFCLFFIPETNQHKHPDNLKPRVLWRNLSTLFAHRQYVGYVLCVAAAHGVLLAWFTAGPVLLMETLGYSALTFSWVFAASSIFFMTSAYLNARFVGRYGAVRMLGVGVALAVTAAILMLISHCTGQLHLWGIIIPIYLYILGCGFIFGNALAGALNLFPKIVGASNAASGASQLLGGAIGSTIAAISPEVTQLPLASIMLGGGLIIASSYLCLVRKSKSTV